MIKEKLNPTFISQYKTVFSEQLIAQAFKEKEMLTGKEILNISPIKQLNIFDKVVHNFGKSDEVII